MKLVKIGIIAIIALIAYYILLPTINIQDPGFWCFMAGLVLVYTVLSLVLDAIFEKTKSGTIYGGFALGVSKNAIYGGIAFCLIVAVFFISMFISSPIFFSNSYTKLLNVELDGNFNSDVAAITFDQIPSLDKQSAQRLGDRKMGEFADLVSQFEVSDEYVQINYQNRPVRVTPLLYGDFFKLVGNRGNGIPGYIMIDMVTQEAEVVRLNEGVKYSRSEMFGRNIDRHVRFNYPFTMFARSVFEIDESGNPYWLYPTMVRKIGLTGGRDVDGLVIVDAITGGHTHYKLQDVPEWADHVFPSELILEQYDYYGAYQSGWLNSVFGQRGVTMTTEGYNFLVIGDDLYVYTGITSVGRDESNIGFLLTNQRTKEATYYSIPGSHEYSAMDSAEGAVQHLRYRATFPLLLNIAGEPTYFIALKDDALLVKMYAMVNVGRYNIVGTGQSVYECEQDYKRKLSTELNVEVGDIDVGSGPIDYIVVYIDGQPYRFEMVT
ncbi:MAG: hypothetical protein LBV40_03525 [Methanomicrobiales archaeon]|jgi:hypothetical protein|nr:hypothetical protein [Methanomicrobiales archaeon]